ncbi:MAG: hypothetical protein KKA54_15705 [Proteobacteria bacterium]|nr:hypothetical protein [Pseudomonadota bacterium]MBU0967817.1 hypothetical protein [Pseudomonadota bacterium]
MKLTENVIDRAEYAAKRYDSFKEAFVRFMKGAAYLTEPSSPIRGLSIEPSLDKNHFDVTFVGMTIRFCFLVQYGTDNALTGRVVIVRETPTFSDTPDIIGAFSFNGKGVTDFDVAEGDDKLEIEYNAVEIVLHFLDQALAKPFP